MWFIILGKGSGGTSMMSKALMDSGVKMFHKRCSGYFEDLEAYDINEAVLRSHGYKWYNCDKFLEAKEKELLRMKGYIEKRKAGNHKFVGFKDPRNTFTFYNWKKLIPNKIIAVIMRRGPQAVVKSNVRKFGHDPQLLMKAWENYNEHADLVLRDNNVQAINVIYEYILYDEDYRKYLIRKFKKMSGLNLNLSCVDISKDHSRK